MATQVTYVGDGATVTYAIPFDYSTDGSDLNVTVDAVPVTFTLDNASTIRLPSAPPAGSGIRIFRKTPFENLEVIFADSSILSADDLNNSSGQLFRRVQEVADDNLQISSRALTAPEGETLGNLADAGSRAGRLLGFGDAGSLRYFAPGEAGGPIELNAETTSYGDRSVAEKLREVSRSVRDTQFAGGAKGDAVYDPVSDTLVSGTDDTAAFLAALAVGGEIVVPKGIYKVTARLICFLPGTTLRLEAGAWIMGNPWRYAGSQMPFGSLLLFQPGADNCAVIGAGRGSCGFRVLGASEANGVTFLHCGKVTARGFSILKDKSRSTAIIDDTFQTGLFSLNGTHGNPKLSMSDAVFEDVEVDGFVHYGFQFWGNLANGVMRRCVARNMGIADQDHSRGSALAITRGVRQLAVTFCTLENNKEFGVLGSSAGDHCYDIKIEDNRVAFNGRGGISWTEEANLASLPGIGTTKLAIRRNLVVSNGKGNSTTGKVGIRVGTYDAVGFIRDFDVSQNIYDDNVGFNELYQSNSDPEAAVRDGVSFGNQGRIGADTILGMAVGANVLRLRHQNVYDGDRAKAINDNQSYWTNLQLKAGWGDAFGAPFPKTSYMVDPFGYVNLRIQAQGGNLGEVAASLPEGLWPQSPIMFGEAMRGHITADGAIIFDTGSGPFIQNLRFLPYAK